MERRFFRMQLASLALAGAAGIGGFYAGSHKDQQPTSNPIVNNSAEIQKQAHLAQLAAVEDKEIEQALQKSNIYDIGNNYRASHFTLEQYPKQIAAISGKRLASSNQFMPEALRQVARKHLKEGVALINFLSEENQKRPDFLPDKTSQNNDAKIKLDPKTNSLSIDKIKLDLSNDFQFQLAQAIIFNRFEILDSAYTQSSASELQKAEGDFFWLAQSEINIIVEPSIQPLISDDHLRLLASSLKTLQASDLPFPRSIKYKIKEDSDEVNGAAWYLTHAHPNPFTMVITELAGEETVYHELGHFVSDANMIPGQETNSKLKQFSQEEFSKMLKDLGLKNRNRAQTAFTALNPQKEDSSFIEEYAEAFRSYFYNGREFRKLIKESINPDRREILLAEYKFMKSLAKGFEFEFGQPISLLPSETPIFKYDTIQVLQLDPLGLGVILHPEPDLKSHNPDLPRVQDGSVVTILDGPVSVSGETNEPTELWKVKYRFYGKNETKDVEGWISRAYFYKILPANQASIPQNQPVLPVSPALP